MFTFIFFRKALAAVLLLTALPIISYGQTDSLKTLFKIKGFLDTYYAYDFNRPDDHIRQPFLYNHNRHNEFNVNLAMLQATFTQKGVRVNLGLMAGTYAQDNYADEENLLKNIFEANVGVALNKRRSLWLDAGIFPSHIGFESAISIQNPTLTRSLLAENSPYFLSGAKLSWDISEAWSLSALVTNGWQRIARPFGNQVPGMGTQLHYHPHKGLALNWSTFAGSEAHDSLNQTRLFNNLYLELKPTQNLQLIYGFDIGSQRSRTHPQGSIQQNNWHVWYTPVIIGRVAISERLFVAARAEYYDDPDGVIISYGAPAGFETFGISANFDFYIQKNTMFRIEARSFRSNEPLFAVDGGYKESNTFVTGSLAISFP
ncbi:hypothetical protein D770_00490 [Flammeovirgaceae bacterium 311]|nr:hypothetical protein D770_00490 [Flammeovirgaceae bacterium 311]